MCFSWLKLHKSEAHSIIRFGLDWMSGSARVCMTVMMSVMMSMTLRGLLNSSRIAVTHEGSKAIIQDNLNSRFA